MNYELFVVPAYYPDLNRVLFLVKYFSNCIVCGHRLGTDNFRNLFFQCCAEQDSPGGGRGI